MSFGYSIGDFVLLATLAYKTVQNARAACGAHDSLTREVGSLHIVLKRLEIEVSKSDSILNRTEDHRRRELATLASDCQRVLNVLSQILEKYNSLPDEKRSATKLWQRVRFGNGEMQDVGKIRSEVATYTQALTLFLNLLSIGTLGKIEVYMDSHGDDLRDIKQALHWVTASMQADSHGEKSILTSYTEDDKAIWKDFRRELIKEGFSSRLLDKHRKTIKRYVIELGERGVLDDIAQEEPELVRQLTPVSVASCSQSPSTLVPSYEVGEVAKRTEVSFENIISISAREESSSSDEADETLFEEDGEMSLFAPDDPIQPSGAIPQNLISMLSVAKLADANIEHDDELEDSNESSSGETEVSDNEAPTPGSIQSQAQLLEVPRQSLPHPRNTSIVKATVFKPDLHATNETQDDHESTTSARPNSMTDDDIPLGADDVNSEDQRPIVHGQLLPATSSDTRELSILRPEGIIVSNHKIIEEVEDEDFLPGAHPNCGTDDCELSGTSTPIQKGGISLEQSLDASTTTPKHYPPHPDFCSSDLTDDSLQIFVDENLADISSSDDEEESASVRGFTRSWSWKPPKKRAPWCNHRSSSVDNDRLIYIYELKDETLMEYRYPSERIRIMTTTPAQDTETLRDGNIEDVYHFAPFDFSSGPENLRSSDDEIRGVERLSGEQKQAFEQWLTLRRGDRPPSERHKMENSKKSSRCAVWGSASEREERRDRLKLRRKYIGKTQGVVNKPPRHAVPLSSAAPKRDLSGPATKKPFSYPFVRPCSWVRYGSPLVTEVSSSSCSTSDDDQLGQSSIPSKRKERGMWKRRFIARWGSLGYEIKVVYVDEYGRQQLGR